MAKKYKKRSPSLIFFGLLIFVALIVVTVLEYLDFQKGKESFIFNKLLKMQKLPARSPSFTEDLLNLFKELGIKTENLSKEGQLHIKSNLKAGQKDNLIDRVNQLALELGQGLRLAEIKRLGEQVVHLYEIYHGRKITHLLLLSIKDSAQSKETGTQATTRPGREGPKKPRLAFIIDDIGYTRDLSLELKKLNIPLTASIIPQAPYAQEEGRKLTKYNLEHIIHLPMQSKGMGEKFRGKGFVTIHSTYSDMKNIIQEAKNRIPGSKGLNNHMGSLITTDGPVMRTLLEVLKEEELFFIDSKTAVDTIAYSMAKQMGIRTAFRDVFLDHVQTYSHTMHQIQMLVGICLKKGKALAIGHPFRSTLKAIRDSQDYIRSKGIEIVFASTLLE